MFMLSKLEARCFMLDTINIFAKKQFIVLLKMDHIYISNLSLYTRRHTSLLWIRILFFKKWDASPPIALRSKSKNVSHQYMIYLRNILIDKSYLQFQLSLDMKT